MENLKSKYSDIIILGIRHGSKVVDSNGSGNTYNIISMIEIFKNSVLNGRAEILRKEIKEEIKKGMKRNKEI